MTQREGEFGTHLRPEKIAYGTIYFNRFVKYYGTDDGQVQLCGANEDACGVAEFDLREDFSDGTTRTGWKDGEELKVKNTGVAIVEAGAAISVFAEVKSDSTGRAVTSTRETITSTPTQADVEAVRDQDLVIKGKALEAATQAGDLITVQLKNMG